ncbi:hypothetical protein BJX65DRAFT_307949 [Aspergillus insuetus]
MPYYGMPVGTKYEEVGLAFSREIVTDLLRGELGFDGIICTDWWLVTDVSIMGQPMPARAWGCEHLTPPQQIQRILEAGCDLFGGEALPELVVQLVEDGLVSMARIDESVRRFYCVRMGQPAFVEEGELAQRRSYTLLKNNHTTLPLSLDTTVRNHKVYVEGINPLLLQSRGLTTAVQNVLSTVWVLFASPIAGAITPQGWYGLGAVLAGVEFLLAFFLLPETKYERSLASYQENVPAAASSPGDDGMGGKMEAVIIATQRVPLDFETYPRRTWKSDMRLWTGNPNWRQAWRVLQQTFMLLLLPNVAWALLLNGLTLGIVVALIALPLLGHGSDWLAKYKARHNNGIHEPEVRLLPLIIPIIIGVFSIVLYGQAAAHPERYHWFIYIWGLAAYNYCFVRANIGAITYLLDSYPGSEGPILITICAFRGIISFGTTYAISPFVERNGYDGAFGIFGALTFVFGLMGILVYIWGKQIRKFTARFGRMKG